MFLQQRVLVAAASEALRKQLFSQLLSRDIFSDAVADGSSAIEKFGTTSYAILLLDLSLDGVDSLQKRVAELPADQRPIVLALSRDHAATGVNDLVQIVLRKPFDVVLIAELVASCLRAVGDDEKRAGAPVANPAPVRAPILD